jgi:UDP-glucuronate 4-epimerase
MNILVTGSAGFIGSHMVTALVNEGHHVVGLDNFNNYYSVQLKRDRHALLTALPNYTGIEGDLCDYPLLTRLFKEHNFDVVCHLAAQAGVRYSLTNPFVYGKSNLEGFINILEACRHARTPRLVYASSSSVYGGNTKLPFSESDTVDHPVSLYAATKKANELMAHTYTHLYGIQTIGLRFFTVYGSWYRPDMALWLFTESMLAGNPIKVFNNGNMRRDFTYIDDIVAGVNSALFRPGLAPYEVFNLGNHQAEKLMDMIHVLSSALGAEPKMDLLPMQPGDVEATYADVSLAGAKLGFKPTTSIEQGIPKFVEWYREYHKC